MDDDNDQKSIFNKITDTVKDIASTAMDAAKQVGGPATGERSVALMAGEGAITDPSPLSTATMPRNPRPSPLKSTAKKRPVKAAKRTTKSAPKKPVGAGKKSAKKSAGKKSGAKKSAGKTAKKTAKKSTKKASKKSTKKTSKKSVKKSKGGSKSAAKTNASALAKKRKTKKAKR